MRNIETKTSLLTYSSSVIAVVVTLVEDITSSGREFYIGII